MKTRRAIACVSGTDRIGQPIRATGFLASERLVLTAWHVVATAVGAIQLEFPGFTTEARVLPDLIDKDSDIVALECASPAPRPPLPLGDLATTDTTWESFGFPDLLSSGLTITGAIADGGGASATGQVQLWARELAGGAQVPGLSGAPCIVDGAAVAVITQAILGRSNRSEGGTVFGQLLGTFIDRCGARLRIPDPIHGLPGLPHADLPNEPFRFLANYGREHCQVFFGRSRDIGALYTQLSDPETPSLQLLYGLTGVGKSSLVAAGLGPRLEAFHQVRLARRKQSSGLVGTLAEVLSVDQKAINNGWRAAEVCGRPLIVFLDQAEESFTRGLDPLKEWAVLIAILRELIQDPRRVQGKLVLSFRKEWLAEILHLVKSAGLPCQQTLINRLDHEGVREVVTGLERSRRLIKTYRLRVEPGLDLVIANALLSDPGTSAAPALQILMTRMWNEAYRRNSNSPRFDTDLYRQVIRDKGLYLKEFLNVQLGEVASAVPDIVRRGLALDVLHFCTTGSATSEARSNDELRQQYRHLPSNRVETAVRVLKDHKLLSDRDGEETRQVGARLMHDALGPFVHEEFHQSQAPGQRARRILEMKVHGWGDGKKGDLIGKTDLRIVDLGIPGMRAPTPNEEEVIKISRVAVARQQRLVWATYGALAILLVAGFTVLLLLRWKQTENKKLSIVQEGASAMLIANEPGRAADALQQAIAAIGQADINGLPHYPEVLQALTLALSAGSESRALCCHNGFVQAVDFSADGRTVASGGRDGYVRLWDSFTGKPLKAWLSPSDPNKATGVFSLAFSSGPLLATTTPEEGLPVIWNANAANGAPILTQTPSGAAGVPRYESVRFAHKHDWLVAAGADVSGGRVTVWNPDGTVLSSKNVNKIAATFAEFGPDDDQIAVGFEDGSVQRYEYKNRLGKEIGARLLGHVHKITPKNKTQKPYHLVPVGAIFFSPGGDALVTGPRFGDEKVIVWDVATSQPRCILASDDDHSLDELGKRVVREPGLQPTGAAISPDGKELLVPTWEQLLLRVDARTCVVRSRIGGHRSAVYSARYSRDGERVATAGWTDRTARLWNFRTGPAILQIRGAEKITSAAFSPGDDELLGGTERGSVLAWDSQRGTERPALPAHKSAIFAVRYSANGGTLLTASSDGVVDVYDRVDGRITAAHHIDVHQPLQNVSLSPDGTHVLTTTLRANAYVWDLGGKFPKQHACCRPLVSPASEWIDKAAFSPFNGSLLATIVLYHDLSPAQVFIWDHGKDGLWRSRKLTAMRVQGNPAVPSFSQDSRFMATAWADQTARIFDTGTGALLATLRGHQNVVSSAIFSPIGYTVATGSRDGTVRLWNGDKAGRFVLWGIVHTGAPVSEVDFSRDGSRILALGSDGIIRIYPATDRGFLAQGCRWLRYSQQFDAVKQTCAPYVADMNPATLAQ